MAQPCLTRGETQAFVTTTLGTSLDSKKMENYGGEWYKKFYLHYNFPPFSVGEARFLRGPGRREIGHGSAGLSALLRPCCRREDDFPYVLRVGFRHLRVETARRRWPRCAARRFP